MALIDQQGSVVAPVPVAPVNETDRGRWPESWQAWTQGAQEGGVDLRGAERNLEGGFASAHNRQCLLPAGLIPNIQEHPRHRKTTRRGRKRVVNKAIHALRRRVERPLAWEDTFKRRLIRFARLQQRHYGMKLLGYTLINLRAFCGT